jgi:hypothetical protein
MQDRLEPLAGGIVLAITLLDVFLTVLDARAGTGLLAPRLARGVWGVFRGLLSHAEGRCAQRGGKTKRAGCVPLRHDGPRISCGVGGLAHSRAASRAADLTMIQNWAACNLVWRVVLFQGLKPAS